MVMPCAFERLIPGKNRTIQYHTELCPTLMSHDGIAQHLRGTLLASLLCKPAQRSLLILVCGAKELCLDAAPRAVETKQVIWQ